MSYWTDAKGHRVEVLKIVDSAMRYLEGLGYFQRWPETNVGFDDYVQRLAPYTFHIVSIQPTIVVMIPHDFGNPTDGRSITQIVGQPPNQSVSTKYMINHIEYGTTFPYHPEALWFSSELRVPPTKIAAHTGEQEIVHPGIKLVITRKDEVCTTKRE